MVYGKQGQLCPHCQQAVIEKIKVAGRGSHFAHIVKSRVKTSIFTY